MSSFLFLETEGFDADHENVDQSQYRASHPNNFNHITWLCDLFANQIMHI